MLATDILKTGCLMSQLTGVDTGTFICRDISITTPLSDILSEIIVNV